MKVTRQLRRTLADQFRGGAGKRFTFFAAVLGVLLIAALVFVGTAWPELQIDPAGLSADDRLQRENELRTTGLQALAGIVLAIGGAFTAYSVLSNREGQLDERFARALELLAESDAHGIRGGAHSLERIAVQSGFDRPAVVEVLAGFIRDRTRKAIDREGDEPPLPEVIEVLTVLSRVKDLPGSPLPYLSETRWWRADLAGMDLKGALMEDCDLSHTDLSHASLLGASLLRADLTSVLLLWANLIGANLCYASLGDANLIGAKLTGAKLCGAKMMKAHLNAETELSGADLSGAVMLGAEIAGADLSRANIADALWSGARYTPETRFPKSFDPEEHGMRLDRTIETYRGEGP